MFAEFETAIAAELNAFALEIFRHGSSPSAGALRARDQRLSRLTYVGCHEGFRINAANAQDLNCTFQDCKVVRAKIALEI